MFTAYIGCILLMKELLVCISLLGNSSRRGRRGGGHLKLFKAKIGGIFMYNIINNLLVF